MGQKQCMSEEKVVVFVFYANFLRQLFRILNQIKHVHSAFYMFLTMFLTNQGIYKDGIKKWKRKEFISFYAVLLDTGVQKYCESLCCCK